jgi:8-amino-7-oxononanoate synthase
VADAAFLTRRLNRLRQAGTYRSLPGQRTGTDFWSNDYLGFGRRRFPGGDRGGASTGSRVISGDHGHLSVLERHIANFHGLPAALLFGSGYLANLGLLSCLPRRTDTILYDELIHASLRDGIRLSGAAARRCQHNSTEDVERQLQKARPDGQCFVVTESRFSMDGDLAPLTELAAVCERHGAHLIVDEAHSVGLEGTNGSGLVAQHGLQDRVFATIVTYGKGPGYHGAAILGGEELRNYLINFSRPFIYTTAPPPDFAAGLNQVYDLLESEQSTAYKRLLEIIEHYRSGVCERGLAGGAILPSGPIQTISLPGNEAVMKLELKLAAAGILVKGIRSPTVAAGTERLRICLHAFNTPEEVDRLLDELQKFLNG